MLPSCACNSVLHKFDVSEPEKQSSTLVSPPYPVQTPFFLHQAHLKGSILVLKLHLWTVFRSFHISEIQKSLQIRQQQSNDWSDKWEKQYASHTTKSAIPPRRFATQSDNGQLSRSSVIPCEQPSSSSHPTLPTPYALEEAIPVGESSPANGSITPSFLHRPHHSRPPS